MEEAHAGSPAPVKVRSAFLDNAKAGLITLVVFTHLFSISVARDEPAHSVYLLILLFHMPAFIFVTGMLAKPYEFTVAGATALGKIVWLYLLFNTINYVWGYVFFGTQLRLAKILFDPVFALWFLLAMVWWRLALPLFSRGHGVYAAGGSIAAAVVVAVASGYLVRDGEWMAVARTFTFLPFYVAGYWAKRMGWSLPRTIWSRVAAGAVFAGVFAAIYSGTFVLTPEFLFGRVNYREIDQSGSLAALSRVGWFALSGVLIAAVLQFVPRSKNALTALGATTLSVYVWHALFVRNIKYYDLTELFAGSWVAVLVTTVVLVMVFGFGPIPRVTNIIAGTPLKKKGA